MDQLIYASAAALARQIRTGEISAQAVVEACLARIEAVNPQINAAVQVTAETARAWARAADQALQRGEDVGPLHGVPFTVKDIFDVTGVISAAGLEERRNFRPERDACVVSRLKAAGAILLGKTNCPPGGRGGESSNPVYGRTNNPYDLTRTAGSSTSGEAALIAAGGSPPGLGSNSGGSLRLPPPPSAALPPCGRPWGACPIPACSISPAGCGTRARRSGRWRAGSKTWRWPFP